MKKRRNLDTRFFALGVEAGPMKLIEVWYGDGDRDPIGPIEAELVSELEAGRE